MSPVSLLDICGRDSDLGLVHCIVDIEEQGVGGEGDLPALAGFACDRFRVVVMGEEVLVARGFSSFWPTDEEGDRE